MSITSFFINLFASKSTNTSVRLVSSDKKKPKTKITVPKSDPMYYFQLARQQFEVGENHIKSMQQFHKQKLASMKSQSVKKVKISTVPTSCAECKGQNGMIFKIDDAIRLNPLPCPWCKNEYCEVTKLGWCRCIYYVA